MTMAGKGMGVEIDLDAIPYHPSIIECSQVLGIPLFNIGLGVGDWNIVYAVEEDAFEALKSEALSKNAHLTVIGRFTERAWNYCTRQARSPLSGRWSCKRAFQDSHGRSKRLYGTSDIPSLSCAL